MATFKSFSEIVSAMVQRLRLSQPDLDTKPGSVSRDLFIDLPADEISKLYSALSIVSQKQSLATTSGRDLDRLGANFGASRGRGSAASGIVVFVTNNLVSDIPIPNGTIVTSRSGINFRTVGNFVMSASERNRLAANATRMRKSLDIAGLSSVYAIEVPIQADRPGTSGNVSSLQINRTSLQGPAGVINLVATTGGSNLESDNSFRTRVLSVFSGANIGTSAGYRNALLGIDGVIDALVVEPGNALMLRDGSETISLSDGTSRILNSGSGGKVDVYVLGRKIEPVSESYIFTDISGSGNISDERNDYILGQGNQDITRTSEERRVLAFKNGVLPAQPIDSIVSIVGSQSGRLTESFFDDDGIERGHYRLEKDLNPETGGSPFGFDKIHFISSRKDVSAETKTKGSLYSYDSPEFSGTENLKNVYQDVIVSDESASITSEGSEYIQLSNTPVRRVSRIQNKSTGEIYTVIDQNLDRNGLNTTGVIRIAGRSLPSSSSDVRANYTWRRYFSEFVDFSGGYNGLFSDPDAADSIDWSQTGAVREEETLVQLSDDGSSYRVELNNEISKVFSVYTKSVVESEIVELTADSGDPKSGVKLSLTDSSIESVFRIRRISDGLELYNSPENDGYFVSREIFLPSDSQASIGDGVIVEYNRIELFDVDKADGSFYKNNIILPSSGVLEAANALSIVEDLYFSENPIYVTYSVNTKNAFPEIQLSKLPISGNNNSDLLSSSESIQDLSSQPISYNRGLGFDINIINRFSPTPLNVSIKNTVSSGKIKVVGTSLNIYTVELTHGVNFDGMIVNLESEIKELLETDEVSDNVGIAKVNRLYTIDSSGEVDAEFDVFGCSLFDNSFSTEVSSLDSSIENYKFIIPSNYHNNLINLSSSDKVFVNFMLFDRSASEEIFFAGPSQKSTVNRFGRIESIVASSGFRNNVGAITGSVSIDLLSQPNESAQYFVDYSFKSPKEGERLTVSYNVNRLLIDATSEIERVRPITADVLIKEAEEILIDVQGTILVNDNLISSADSIVEAVSNAVTRLLTGTRLGDTVDYSDVVSAAASQNGVDSVNVSIFNESGLSGRKAFIRSLDNQFISPGTISFEAVSRSKFKIN